MALFISELWAGQQPLISKSIKKAEIVCYEDLGPGGNSQVLCGGFPRHCGH
jgi:hypothetical protein